MRRHDGMPQGGDVDQFAEAPVNLLLADQEISSALLVDKYGKRNETSVHDVYGCFARARRHEEKPPRGHWAARFLWAQEDGIVPADGDAVVKGTQSRAKAPGDESVDIPFTRHGERQRISSLVSATLRPAQYRVEHLDSLKHAGATRVVDAMFCRRAPKTSADGPLSWTVDVVKAATGEDFLLGRKAITLPDGVTRPSSVWLSGNHPRVLGGLTKRLSFAMRVLDPAWFGLKRRNFGSPEPLGTFMPFLRGPRRQNNLCLTVAARLRLFIHCYTMLGILDASGLPLQQTGILQTRLTLPRRRRRRPRCAASGQPDDDPERRRVTSARLAERWAVALVSG